MTMRYVIYYPPGLTGGDSNEKIARNLLWAVETWIGVHTGRDKWLQKQIEELNVKSPGWSWGKIPNGNSMTSEELHFT